MTAPGLRHSLFAGCLVAWLATPGQAQTPDMLSPNVLNNNQQLAPVVTGAPFAADSVLIVTLTTFGAPVEQRVVARVYRDSAGRVRREQTVTGQERPAPSDPDLVVAILDPVAGVLITLNPASRTAHRMPLSNRGGAADLSQIVPRAESLGTQVIGGIAVSGRRTVTKLPAGTDGRAVEIQDERWESSDLQVALVERHVDSRNGVLEHRLTNIVRTEPAPQLFAIPATYTIVEVIVPAAR